MRLDLTPGYSKSLIAMTCLASVFAVVAIYTTNLRAELSAALSFAALVSGAYHITWLMGSASSSIRRVQYLDGDWWLTFQSGRLAKASLINPVVVLPWLVSARFRVGSRLFQWLVTVDALRTTEHRRLRVAMRFAEVESQLSIDRVRAATGLSLRLPESLSKPSLPKSGRHKNRV